MLETSNCSAGSPLVEAVPDDSNGNAGAADRTPTVKKGHDPATGWRLSDTFTMLKNIYLKARFFFYILLNGRGLNRPYYVHYQITRRCNFRCPSCRTWQDESYTKGLSLDEIKVMAHNLRKIGIKCVALTGGEATLRKDVCDVIRAFRNEGLMVRLQTNAFLLTEGLIERIYRAGATDIFISYDSVELETFNRINGVSGPASYERVTTAIKTASAMGKRFGAGVFLTAVMRGENAREVVPLHNFAKEAGALIGFFAMEVPNAEDPMNIRNNDPSLRATPEVRKDLEQVFGEIIAMRRKGGHALSISERLLKDYIAFYRDPDGDMHWKCRAGRMFMAILPEGTICVCNGTPHIPGWDYRTLPELYARADREEIFDKYRTACSGCICMRQLEYIADDRTDLLGKGISFSKALLGLK